MSLLWRAPRVALFLAAGVLLLGVWHPADAASTEATTNGPASSATVEAPSAATVAAPSDVDPAEIACRAAISHAQPMVDRLPPAGMTRRFAESYLVQAGLEAGNHEFDDCVEYAQRAESEIRQHLHDPAPPAAKP